MPFTRKKKEEIVKNTIDVAKRATAFIFADFFKLKTKEMEELRRAVKALGGNIKIVKKTLASRSLGEAFPKEFLIKPGSVALIWFENPDVIEGFKAVMQFSKTHETLAVLGGYMKDTGELNIAQVKAIAALPGVEMLRAMLVGALAAPLRQLLWVLKGNQQRLVMTLAAIQSQRSK